MAEEEKKPTEEKAEKKEKQEKPAAPTQEPAAEPKGEKHKKINQLSLDEIEQKLKIVKEKMGDFQSHYAKNLLSRKKELSSK